MTLDESKGHKIFVKTINLKANQDRKGLEDKSLVHFHLQRFSFQWSSLEFQTEEPIVYLGVHPNKYLSKDRFKRIGLKSTLISTPFPAGLEVRLIKNEISNQGQ